MKIWECITWIALIFIALIFEDGYSLTQDVVCLNVGRNLTSDPCPEINPSNPPSQPDCAAHQSS